MNSESASCAVLQGRAGRWSIDAINYFVAQPVKGARMYEIYEHNGWLNHSDVTTQADHSWPPTGLGEPRCSGR
jgi:hypothetical protein